MSQVMRTSLHVAAVGLLAATVTTDPIVEPNISKRLPGTWPHDFMRCTHDPSGQAEGLLNATEELAARLGDLYVAEGQPRPFVGGRKRGSRGSVLPGVATGGGALISDLELLVRLSQLLSTARHAPLNIFGIGNAFGYSTLALALAFPGARIAILDAHELRGKGRGIDVDVGKGTNLTRRIARANGLDVRVHVGASPFDVSEVLLREGMAGRIDLAFIDGAHTDNNLYMDFTAVKQHMLMHHGIVIFHDVALSTMYRGIHAIEMDARASEAAHGHAPHEHASHRAPGHAAGGSEAAAADEADEGSGMVMRTRIYHSANYCNEFGTALLDLGTAAERVVAQLGPRLRLPERELWSPVAAPIYPQELMRGGASVLVGHLDFDESPRPSSHAQ